MGRRSSKKSNNKKRQYNQQAPTCLQQDRRIKHPHYDLMVHLPSSTSPEVQIQSQLLMRSVVHRLASTGFSTMAFVHTVYGRPKPKVDNQHVIFPAYSFFRNSNNDNPKVTEGGTTNHKQQPSKRRRVMDDKEAQPQQQRPSLRILKRLHAVVENLSDLATYSSLRQQPSSEEETGSTFRLLQEYDIISISPRNDATFQAACATATAADIVTLDYTAGRGGVQLPFRIRSCDIQAVVDRGAVLELPYAPALLHPNQKRKALVQAARQVQMASIGVRPKPRILLSSGDRTRGDVDVGAMALRSSGDLINVLQIVLQFDQTTSYDALSASGTAVLTRARQRRMGGATTAGNVVVDVDAQGESDALLLPPSQNDVVAHAPLLGDDLQQKVMSASGNEENKTRADKTEMAEDDLEDGFITLT